VNKRISKRSNEGKQKKRRKKKKKKKKTAPKNQSVASKEKHHFRAPFILEIELIEEVHSFALVTLKRRRIAKRKLLAKMYRHFQFYAISDRGEKKKNNINKKDN
jgi:hypothetical protein